MSNVTVKLKLKGINALMTSPGVTAEVARRVKRGASAAGSGFEGVVVPHKWTARGYVRTRDDAGKRDQANNQSLMRALDAMR